MKFLKPLALVLILCSLAFVCVRVPDPKANFVAADNITLIAHAGGGLDIGAYSNSRQAFDRSARSGFTLIEADFSQTKNGDWVLAHDWDKTHYLYFSRFSGMPGGLALMLKKQPDTAQDFKARTMRGDLTPMDVDDLLAWMSAHPTVSIVTDFKGNNIEGLRALAAKAGDQQLSIIPQIYTPSEYKQAKALGYEHIILTTYRLSISDQALTDFMNASPLFALTMPPSRITHAITDSAAALGVPVFTHTINDPVEAERFKDAGVSGLYTDYLVPDMKEATLLPTAPQAP